ncbi:MAG: hypothetical protein WCH01_11575 [Methylococcaceae bacterium]
MTTATNPAQQSSEEIARLKQILSQQQQAFALDPMPELEERKKHLKTLRAAIVATP